MYQYKKLGIQEIGAKAYNLNVLENAGFKVPHWFCVPDNMLKNYDEGVKNEILNFLSLEFADNSIFSVRSSASSEDSENYSFAGQFNSYLNVDKADVILKIEQCYNEIINYNNKEYNDNKEKITAGIIVQEMIIPELSGVMFTANPLGILNEMIITCGKGVGKNVVEDIVPITTYYYNMHDSAYYYEIQETSPLLESNAIEELIKLGKEIYGVYDKHIDIEWCMRNDKIYILQARPITTIDTKKMMNILDNSNIVESYPNITLPLTQSFVKQAYYMVFRRLFKRMVCNEKVVSLNEENLKEMVTAVNGRMYYKINNWYTFIKILPFNNKIIPIWQEMLGVKNKEIISNEKPIGILTKINVCISSIYLLMFTNKKMKKLNEFFLNLQKEFIEKFNEKLTNEELISLYNDISKKLVKDWDITLANDMNTFIFTSLVKKQLKKLGHENYDVLANEYISGLTDIDSMKPINKLIEISKQLASDEMLKTRILNIENNDEYYTWIRNEENITVKEEIVSYINQYGDRCFEELKLESKTFRSHPIILINKIKEYIENIELLNEKQVQEQKSDKVNIKNILLKTYINRATIGIKNREISRLNRSRVYGMIRRIFNQIGKNIYEENLIDNAEDIFYFSYEELLSFIQNKEDDIRQIIISRKEKYEMFKKIPAFSRLIFLGCEFDKSISNIQLKKVKSNFNNIYGIACSNGTVEGEVLIVDNPNDVKEVANKIIVTKMTDPGWVFILTLAKGIISEKGSLLSHTAIISRELKIPSVVGVNDATNILKNGDYIRINGNTGEINILKEKENV